MHATTICFNNLAYVIMGPSGVGKSAFALSLIHRGATLIADDATQIQGDYAYAPKTHQGWLEVRGIGLISGFPVCPKAKIGAFIEITSKDIERTPLDSPTKIPTFKLKNNDPFIVDKFFVIQDIIDGKLKKERI